MSCWDQDFKCVPNIWALKQLCLSVFAPLWQLWLGPLALSLHAAGSPQPHTDTGCSSCANLIHFSPLVVPIIRLVCHVHRTLGSFAVVSLISAQLLVAFINPELRKECLALTLVVK